MVRLTKIYTRTGDDGTTGLADGSRVRKDDLRVEAYGTVDEANSTIGVCVATPGGHRAEAIAALLRAIQHDLFDAGADLSTPVAPNEALGSRLRITAAQTAALEKLIDQYNEPLGSLTSFVLPGGTALSAALHIARTVVRRAERLAVTLGAAEPAATNPECVRYLNRLSDLLFVLARAANDDGRTDVLWVPGKNRGG